VGSKETMDSRIFLKGDKEGLSHVEAEI